MLRLLTATVLCTATMAFAALPDAVKIDAGQLSGIPGKDPSVRVFRGVPYGAPPVGENRWKAPQPVAKWEGVRKADTLEFINSSEHLPEGLREVFPNGVPE